MSEAEAPTKPVEAVEAEPAVRAATDAPAAEPAAAANDSTEQKEDAESKANVLKTSAKTDYSNPKNNRKFDPNSREVTSDPAVIRKQVEFYFGDWNFPQDKFMWETCGGSENKPMPVKTIHSFKRMRSFQPYSAVVAALKDSELLDIEGEEGEETIKRKVPYKPMAASKAKFEAATVYVKGFGDEKPDTQFQLESFFANFGEVKGLKLRRTNQNLFKGSVFVTFADEETADKFIKSDPAPKWQDHDLKVMSKQAYCEEKNEMIREGKLEPNSTAPRRFYEGKDSNTRDRNGRDRGPRDRDNWKQRRDYDQKHGFNRRGGGRGRGGRGRGGRDRRDRDGRNDMGEVRSADKGRDATYDEPAESEDTTTNGKRAREENGGADEAPAAKKVDTKEVGAEA